MKNPFSLTRLASVDAQNAGHAALGAITAIQHLTPEEQVAGLAVAFQLLSQKTGAHMGTVLQVANNLVDSAAQKVPALGATIDYLREEIK